MPSSTSVGETLSPSPTTNYYLENKSLLDQTAEGMRMTTWPKGQPSFQLGLFQGNIIGIRHKNLNASGNIMLQKFLN